ncbi:MAG: XAC2610-related protein [Bacteroidales bacterium]
MTTKSNRLYGLMNHLLPFLFSVVVISCNSMPDYKISYTIPDTLQTNTATDLDKTLSNINLQDTIKKLMTISLSKDTFEYEAFYNENSPYLLLYFKTGKLFSDKTRHAIVLYSRNDTTVVCELYYLANNKWTNTESNISMPIDGFSPAFFSVSFDDFNFDGYNDFKANFYQTMRVADTYGYIITFNAGNNSMTLHPETIKIPNLEIEKKNKAVFSTVNSNPNTDIENFKMISKFAWTHGKLELLTKKKHKLKLEKRD